VWGERVSLSTAGNLDYDSSVREKKKRIHNEPSQKTPKKKKKLPNTICDVWVVTKGVAEAHGEKNRDIKLHHVPFVAGVRTLSGELQPRTLRVHGGVMEQGKINAWKENL